VFSGIVEAMGTIRDVEERRSTRRFRVEAPSLASELGLGDSVAVDGACLTVTEYDGEGFAVDVIGTTLERTIAGTYTDGHRVNLERALRMGARLDGHLVQGHVDTVGNLRQVMRDGEYWTMDFEVGDAVFDETIEHGSITLNGVSLTVSELLPDRGVRIGVIPFTFEHTNLGLLEPGAPVNVEGDLIGKYVARILSQRGTRDV
jgi:riboflavin synthase